MVASKLIIVMVNTDPRNGEELGAPFFQATVAAAMDYEVDVICTATAGQLMKKGVAERLVVKPGSPKTVYDFIKDAHEAGAKFYCCSPNLDLFDMTEDDLIPECEGIVGGAKVIEEIMENDDAKVLTYSRSFSWSAPGGLFDRTPTNQRSVYRSAGGSAGEA
ncbi:DsrE/DsrF/DrsH-like family protein [Devosia sp.]|uniref:DsrE/DsrF/DrsH-like family protein n=1 Tax=Devosia sp. TaxID=1871048 RepID=UPI0027357E05|nr:DsrE/DsrF/DrsH-like family protein [Devosia sp.]MDP2780265.1 DsrE/DsrF/DrsH-like family protein [Devosia sp.]